MKPHSSDSGAKRAAAGTELGEAVALPAKVEELEAEKAMAAATAEAKLVKAAKCKTANQELRKSSQIDSWLLHKSLLAFLYFVAFAWAFTNCASAVSSVIAFFAIAFFM